MTWIENLINVYGYDSRQMEIEVPAGAGVSANRPAAAVRADIVVYRDRERTEAFIVIETKAPGKKEGVPQAQSYARNLGAEYFIWTNGSQAEFYRTSRYGADAERVGNIPHWVGQAPVVRKLPKTETLPPFRNEAELRGIVQTCHNLIWEKMGHDPAKSFDELTKLLFLKLYDERETPIHYEFMVYAEEKPVDTASRLRALFDTATTKSGRYRDVFLDRFGHHANVHIDLDDQTLTRVVSILQGYSLINTTNSIQGADIKGTVYEQMVGSTFRGDLGQFFTARQMVEFMVRFLEPKRTDRVLDPACGSAGLLIMVIKYMRERMTKENPNLNETGINDELRTFCESNVFGTDINERIARVAKMNMIMHGDGHAGIFNSNGLILDTGAPDRARKEIREGSFDIILSNPPFAGYEKDPSILTKFDTGKNAKGAARSVTREVLFIERIIRLLAPGGRAAIVLPQGVFSDRALSFVRDYIRAHAKIIGVIGMPDWAFIPSGTSVRGSIIFIEKADPPPADYQVFFREAEHVGYTSTGLDDPRTDFDTILLEYQSQQADRFVPISEVGDRLDAKLYAPQARALLSLFGGSRYPYQPLGDVAQISPERAQRNKLGDGNILYVEVGDINGVTETISPKTIRAKDAKYGTLLRLAEGDILMSRRRPYLRATVLVDADNAGAYTIPECSVVRIADPDLRAYVYELLRSRPFVDLMMLFTTGEMSMRIAEEDLAQMPVPVPPTPELHEIATNIRASSDKARELMREAKRLNDEKASYVTRVLEKENEDQPVPAAKRAKKGAPADEPEPGITRDDFFNVLRRIKKAPSQSD